MALYKNAFGQGYQFEIDAVVFSQVVDGPDQVVELDADDDVFDAVQRVQPDVLLLDVHLQKINGLDVLDQVRANAETRDVPVVMASGLNLEEECLRRGANDFLLKPYMPDDLLKLLSKNLKGT